MGVNYQLIDEVKTYVTKLFKENLSNEYIYHNYAHTKEVVETCQEIAEHSELNEDEFENLLIAAWFHDTGYIVSGEEHEEKSTKIMKDFFENKKNGQLKIDKIEKIILSTKSSVEPKNIQEKIIKDADLVHIGKEKFDDKGQLLRREWELLYNKKYSDLDWQKNQISFLSNKKFYTDYAMKKFGDKLQQNIADEKIKLEHTKRKSE